MRYLPLLLAAPLFAQQITAPEILEKVRHTYRHLEAFHIVAEREESHADRHGRPVSKFARFELAENTNGRYFARFSSEQDSLAISDGSTTWKALISGKQWSQISAGGAGDDDDAEPAADLTDKDLHSNVQRILLSHFVSLAKNAEEPVRVKEEDYKLGPDRVPCYLIRAHTPRVEFEWWVDREKFIVLHSKQKTEKLATEVRVKQLELNGGVKDGLFHFEPEKGWQEVDSLVLPGEGQKAAAGQLASNFTLTSVAGTPVALDSLRGKVVVLDFWATWCPPCREELPHIEKLRTQFGDAVQFFGVNDEGSGTVKRFQKEHHYELPVLMDDQRAVRRLFGVHAFPTLLVLDRGGVIRQVFIGGRSESVLRKGIQEALDAR